MLWCDFITLWYNPAASPAPATNTAQIECSAEDDNVIMAVVSQLFNGADVNQDGRLDAEELAQLLKQHSLSADTKINLGPDGL